MRSILTLLLVTATATVTPEAAARDGDSAYGRIVDVRRADVVVFAHGPRTYTLRLAGISVSADKKSANAAMALLRALVLNRDVRVRLEAHPPDGELRARVFTADPPTAIRDVSVELVRAGLVRRQGRVDFKYGELAAAEKEARTARRGLWSAAR